MKKVNLFLFIIFGIQFSHQVTAQSAKPHFRDGEAQTVAGFNDPKEWIKEELWVQTNFDSDSNGRLDRMHVFLTRPKQTQTNGIKLPVIYMTSPYFAGTAGDSKKYYWNVKHEIGAVPPPHKNGKAKRKYNRPIDAFINDWTWVKRGYITVYSSSPGTGFSDGSPTIGGENEKLAPKAVIDWLCGRAIGYTTRTGSETVSATWCTGKVGMTGTSYNGTLCLAAACTGVEGLEAIIPIAPVSSWYLYYRTNGLVRSPGGYLGEDMDVLYDFVHSGDPENRAHNDSLIRDKVLVPGQDRVTGDFNDFWASRDYLTQMDSMKCALFMCHGFNDWNVMSEHSFRFYEKAKQMGLTSKIYYNQLDHGVPPPFEMMNKWFTHYLHGVDNGVEKIANAWIVTEEETNPIPYSDFPPPNAKDIPFYLNATNGEEGKLALEKTTSNNQTESFTDNPKLVAKELISTKNSANRLLFLSENLKSDLHISGTGKINIQIASSKPAANLSIYLVELPLNYTDLKLKMDDIIVTRAWADPQNQTSIQSGVALVPGQFYDLTFNFQPDDQVIERGKQLGLLIFSSDKGFTLQPEKGTVITVNLDKSFITLPVVGEK